MRLAPAALLFAGCTAPPSAGVPPDVIGPYGGPVARFNVDRITLPMDESRFVGQFVDGGKLVNHFGLLVGSLEYGADSVTAPSVNDQLTSGAVDLTVELQSDDPALRDDPTVGVAIGDGGTDAAPLGASLAGGVLLSNRIRYTAHPVAVRVTLPVIGDADPITVELAAAEIDLEPDGAGGFDAILRGAVRDSLNALPPLIAPALAEQWDAHPDQHPLYGPIFDADHDGALSIEEVAANPLIMNVTSPDVGLFAGDTWSPHLGTPRDSLSVGFGIHLAPCPSGRCAGAIADHCDDRVLDGDESGLDCGGSCAQCPGGATCRGAADCQSGRCTAGACERVPVGCKNGVADGLETDVDCGGGDAGQGSCARCSPGRACNVAADCAGANPICTKLHCQ